MSVGPEAGPGFLPAGGGSPPPLLSSPPGPWGPWATLGFVWLAMGSGLVGSSILLILWSIFVLGSWPPTLDFKELVASADFVSVALVVEAACGAPIVFFAIWMKRPYRFTAYLALTRPPLGWFLVWILVAVAYSFGSSWLLQRWGVKSPEWAYELYRSSSFPPSLWMATCVVAPIWEETLHRGFLFRGVESRWGPAPAILLAVVPWTLLHYQYDWPIMLALAGRGLIYAVARWRTRSLFSAIALHAIDNLSVMVMMAIYVR